MNDTIFVALSDANNKINFDIFLTFVSAFAGAFFAFLFFRLAGFFTNIFKINNAHFEALNKIELMGNEHVDAIGRGIYNIDLLVAQCKKANKLDRILISHNRPKTISFDNDIIINIINVDLINSIFSYKMKLERLNSDIDNINHLTEFFLISLQQKAIDKAAYQTNLNICVEKYLEMKKAFNYMIEQSITLTAIARARKKEDKPSIYNFNYLLVRRSNEKGFDDLLNKEIDLCKKEIEIVRKKSEQEIEKITEKTSNPQPT